MSLRSLLRKELHWSRRNVLVLLFLLLLLPAFFAGTSVLFQEVIPREIPVAVTPADDSVEDSEMEIIESAIRPFTEPTRTANIGEAERMLERESVYAIVEVPPDLNEADTPAEFRFVVDGAIVPFLSPSELIGGLLESELNAFFDADVSTEREVTGDEKTLPEYLFPAFLLALVIFFAFTYVPYNLKNEAQVLDRLRVESSLEAVVASKLLFFTTLLLVPIGVFHAAAFYYGYAIDSLAPGAILTLLLTFLLLGTVSTTVMMLSRLGGVGLFVNVTLMLGLVAFSALAFPLGFFSPLRTTVAQLLPTYYAGVMIRSLMLKGSELTAFTDWLAGLVALSAVAVLGLELSISYYRRTS